MFSILAVTEPSKVPFFVAGGLLAAWAVVLSALGLSQPEFPMNDRGSRFVVLITVVLVAAAMTAAVATA